MGAGLLSAGAVQVVGLDIHQPALDLAATRLSATHRVDLNALPELHYPSGHFDWITFADVLEHLADPAAVLRHLSRWLAPAGRILCSLPNVRHHSVVLPLLVKGRWTYEPEGILDRTHLRFFTLEGARQLLADGGFTLTEVPEGYRTEPPPNLAELSALVRTLGGDAQAFEEECTVYQYYLQARCLQAGESPGPVPRPGSAWPDGRQTRILLAPQVANPSDRWSEVLGRLAQTYARDQDVAITVVLPIELLRNPPADLTALGEAVDCELLLLEAPATSQDWEALMKGASVFVATSPDRPLLELAARLGIPTRTVA
jgi:hypothetical protein